MRLVPLYLALIKESPHVEQIGKVGELVENDEVLIRLRRRIAGILQYIVEQKKG